MSVIQPIKSHTVHDMVWPLEPSLGNDIERLGALRDAGYNSISITIAGDNHNVSQAVQRVAEARRKLIADERLRLVEEFDDIAAAKEAGQLAVSLHFEGTRCFERNLDMVEVFHRIGVRHTLLAFNVANSAGGGCADKRDGGLTAFGRDLVNEMERVGMLIDLSHVGQRTSLEAIEISNRPVIFSHSNVRALAPSFRNLTDEQIRSCARTGGVVGISGSNSYLGCDEPDAEAVFRHIDYIVELVGPDHVGLGLDCVVDAQAVTAYARARPEEWPMVKNPDWKGFSYFSPEDLPSLFERMAIAGYSDETMAAIAGGNFLRVCQEVWG